MFQTKIYRLFLSSCFFLGVFSCDDKININSKKEYWEDPTIISENKEDAHATLFPYNTREESLEGNRTLSKHYRSLNGDWWFNWVKCPTDRPMHFYKDGYDLKEWKKIGNKGIKIESKWNKIYKRKKNLYS